METLRLKHYSISDSEITFGINSEAYSLILWVDVVILVWHYDMLAIRINVLIIKFIKKLRVFGCIIQDNQIIQKRIL
jgi:hypothetical protein